MTTHMENGGNSQGSSPSLAMTLAQLNWGGSNYSAYEGRCDASGANTGSMAAPAAGTGTPAAGAGSPPAGQTPPASSAGTETGAGAAPAGGGIAPVVPNPNDDNLRMLRTNYEALKPWEKVAQTVKDPTQALTAYQRQQKLFDDGLQMAKSLGYTEDSYKAAFEDDPVETISHLRGEHAKANPNAAQAEQMRRAAQDAAREATKPITEQLNRQQTEAAMAKYDTEFSRLISDDKIGFGKDAPEEIKNAMYDLVDQLMPNSVLQELKTQGKVSGVQAIFDQAKGVLIKVVNAYNAMNANRAQAAGGQGNRNFGNRPAAANGANGNGNGAARELTLDDIIDNPEAHLPGLKANKY